MSISWCALHAAQHYFEEILCIFLHLTQDMFFEDCCVHLPPECMFTLLQG